jgi:hypothetical protein
MNALQTYEYNTLIGIDSKDRQRDTNGNYIELINSINIPNQFRSSGILAIGAWVFSMDFNIPNIIASGPQQNNTFQINDGTFTRNIVIDERIYDYLPTVEPFNASPVVVGNITDATTTGLLQGLTSAVNAAFPGEFSVNYNADLRAYNITRIVSPLTPFSLTVSAKTRQVTGLYTSTSFNDAGVQTFLGGATSLEYTRYVDILCRELGQFSYRDEVSSNYFSDLVARIWVGHDASSTATSQISFEYLNIKYFKYQPSSTLGTLHFELRDEWGELLYIPPNYSGNWIINFMTKVR